MFDVLCSNEIFDMLIAASTGTANQCHVYVIGQLGGFFGFFGGGVE